jgi:putative transposase
MISYKYKLYNNKHNDKLHDLCRSSAFVWNHCLALQQRYYKLYGKYISSTRMQNHFAKKIVPKYDFLKLMGSQSIQEIIQRLDASYSRFFKKTQKRPPKFKSGFSFSSFVFKQGGYTLDGNRLYINKLKRCFKFFKSREYGTPALSLADCSDDRIPQFSTVGVGQK